eukprot:7251762-Pyramimonas_sp.AAC.1
MQPPSSSGPATTSTSSTVQDMESSDALGVITDSTKDTCTSLLVGNITCMSQRIWQSLQSQKSRYDMFALVETHVDRPPARKWDQSARAAGLRFFANPARPRRHDHVIASGQVERANEGGEWVLSKRHMQVHSFDGLCPAQVLRAGEGWDLDGMMPVALRLSCYTLILFYGLSSMGVTCPYLPRYQRLGAFCAASSWPGWSSGTSTSLRGPCR